MIDGTRVLADTHVFIWYVQGSARLSPRIRSKLDKVTDADFPILISAVTLVELRYLVEKKKFTERQFEYFIEVLKPPFSSFVVVPMDGSIAAFVGRIPRDAVCDPFDRMIAATALSFGVPLATHDGRLKQLPTLRIIY